MAASSLTPATATRNLFSDAFNCSLKFDICGESFTHVSAHWMAFHCVFLVCMCEAFTAAEFIIAGSSQLCYENKRSTKIDDSFASLIFGYEDSLIFKLQQVQFNNTRERNVACLLTNIFFIVAQISTLRDFFMSWDKRQFLPTSCASHSPLISHLSLYRDV